MPGDNPKTGTREDMKKTLWTAGAVIATASAASAAGIERASNDYGILFQDGHQASVSATFVNPSVSGDYVGGGSTGNMSKNYVAMSASYKGDFGERLSFGLFLNDAYGADAKYTAGAYTGLAAEWDSKQIAAILRYGVTDRFSVYGGFRYVQSDANIVIPGQFFAPRVQAGADEAQTAVDTLAGLGAADPLHPLHTQYLTAVGTAAQLNGVLAAYGGGAGPAPNILDYTAKGDKTGDWGYVVGAAYEKQEIALRVALTYESAITHTFDTREALPGLGIGADTKTEVEMPQSLTLDFQSGVAKDTLVFGSIKWTEWSKWEVRPPEYSDLTGSEITGFDNDTITYRLGVGRKFTDYTSGFAQVRYEKSNGGVASRLAPTDGMFAFGIGGQYSKDNIKLRGGMEYVKLGDAEDASGTKFEGNSAFGVGVSLSMSF
ncbi:outer membrane protein transport protein [Tropicibacter sp. R15_0]|uniref:OmpP1/FadL family transporter n=1 Tax=Tropicibacter sp. R15_0 TaxID=2821101 RepID=UPI001ADA5636|nr:outer membrane protein transport protein [Tropicibacter sp. R15_0]MBO9464605.1 outer membrane protein transport protein [Tropicibacter sp. R15_0]